MKEEKTRKNSVLLAIGIALGMILYKVIFELLWPIVFG